MKFPKEELVSIITPSYNSEKTIVRTINSIQKQTYSNWELIIIDDNSTDTTSQLVQQAMEKDSRITYEKNKENLGPATTRNRAIEKASGRFIAFLDSDDEWLPRKLEKQISFMRDKKISFSCTCYDRVTSNGTFLDTVTPPPQLRYNDLLKHNWVGCLTATYDAKQLGKHYFPNIAKRQDLGLWLSILKKIDCVYCVNESLARYTVGSAQGVSRNKWHAAQYQWKFYRTIEKLSPYQSTWYFLFYTYSGILSMRAPVTHNLSNRFNSWR